MHILGASRGLLCDSSAVLFEDGHLSSKKKKKKKKNNNNMNSNIWNQFTELNNILHQNPRLLE